MAGEKCGVGKGRRKKEKRFIFISDISSQTDQSDSQGLLSDPSQGGKKDECSQRVPDTWYALMPR